MLTIKAHAKINLTLEVLRQRPDGYHEIRSIFQAIDLYDTLHFEEAGSVSISCDMPGWSEGKSLIVKAVQILQDSTGCKKGAKISIEKRIPLLAGLGGDSTDAASVLNGLNDLWKLKLSREKLLLLAAQLGSDVPFFIRGGTALVSGKGELTEPLPPPLRMWVVLVIPDIAVESGKTGRMYAELKPSHFTDGAMTQKLAETLHKYIELNPSMLFNILENVAFETYPGLLVYKDHLMKLGAARVHLAGSGPTLFTLILDKSDAQDLYQRCKDQGMKVYLTKTL